MPSEPWTPRDELGLSASPISSTTTVALSDGPMCTVRLLVRMAGRSAAVDTEVSCAPGMVALPAMPPEKTVLVVPMRTPTAPAATALLNRVALPHARFASSSSHHR